jgi:beta-galactosidase
VGEQLAPLTIQNGGPIIMIQVENEYGSYGEDKPYISAIRDCLRGIYGDKIALFQCDWASNFEKNGLDDLVWTMNFGTGANIDQQFKRLGELRPDAPKMCSEFWSGWFDKWGANHETRPAEEMVDGMDEMLSKGISFSLYMTHGGTSFGHWAGANSPGFAPDVTSYDYDAPINEYGQPTEKFFKLREMMQKFSAQKLPSVPKAPMPIISIPKFELKEFIPLPLAIKKTEKGALKTFEEMDMGWGTMVYSTTMPEIPVKSVLTGDFHDYAQVFINDKYIGKIDRVRNERSLAIPPVKKGDVLTILVEGMGRINFGRAIKDFKGIVGDVVFAAEVDGTEITWKPQVWQNAIIPDDYEIAKEVFDKGLVNENQLMGKIGYYRGSFNLKKVGDTFLNMEQFGKGQVYVNGYAVGRFWNIGPQQTLYVPGCWLKKGQNEVIVLDVVGPSGAPCLFAQDHPELDKLNVEKSQTHNNPGDKPDLNSVAPVAKGAFAAGNGWQMVTFDAPQKGRYVAIEALSTQKGNDDVAIAEIYLRDAEGHRLSREPWTIKYADSEEIRRGNNTADKTYDLQESTYWRTGKGAKLPHLMVIDLGREQTVSGLDYLPRAEEGAPGSIKDYRIFVLP